MLRIPDNYPVKNILPQDLCIRSQEASRLKEDVRSIIALFRCLERTVRPSASYCVTRFDRLSQDRISTEPATRHLISKCSENEPPPGLNRRGRSGGWREATDEREQIRRCRSKALH